MHEQPATAGYVLGWLEDDGVGLGRCPFIFLPHLDGLVSLTCHKSAARYVITAGVDAGLAVQAARLYNRVLLLEDVAALPVPEPDAAIVTTTRRGGGGG